MTTIYETTAGETRVCEVTTAKPCINLLLKPTWANSQLLLALVKKELMPLKTAMSDSAEISLGSWNTEYLWSAKAEHFIESYTEIVSKHHLLALQEVSPQGLYIISQSTGYDHVVSRPNNRGQAVGFLIHPRFMISRIHEYIELMEVFGTNNLRPALRVDLIDTITNKPLSIVTVHLKSMIGGLIRTTPIRTEQLERLMVALGSSAGPTLIAGDFNCFLDTCSDIAPLLNNGFNLVNKNDHTSTQSCGGRLDGLFFKNLEIQSRPKNYNIRNFWRSSLIGRSLSDHGLLTWTIAG